MERQKLIEAIEPVKDFLKIDDKFTTAAGNSIEEALRYASVCLSLLGHVQIENESRLSGPRNHVSRFQFLRIRSC